MHPHQWLSNAANDLAEALPLEVILAVATAFTEVPPAELDTELVKRLPNNGHYSRTKRLMNAWRENSFQPDSTAVACSLAAAGEAVDRERNRRSIEVAWTGPEDIKHTFRRTEQAVLQVIDSAKERILLVSYAVYRIPNIAKALIDASKRGVVITVVLETPNPQSEKSDDYDNLEAIGKNVLNCSRVYYWPQFKRPIMPWGTQAKLHIKCVTSDGEWMFVSSANMTKLAFSINMELGVLVRNRDAVRPVEAHFKSLIDLGVLELV